jgi:sigma-B regulation protein RsbU (phosphoserine phosphatase)
MPDVPFATHTMLVPEGSTLLVFSDGVYEITRPDGTVWTAEEFGALAAASAVPPGTRLESMVEGARHLRGQPELEDDFSLLRVRF